MELMSIVRTYSFVNVECSLLLATHTKKSPPPPTKMISLSLLSLAAALTPFIYVRRFKKKYMRRLVIESRYHSASKSITAIKNSKRDVVVNQIKIGTDSIRLFWSYRFPFHAHIHTLYAFNTYKRN